MKRELLILLVLLPAILHADMPPGDVITIGPVGSDPAPTSSPNPAPNPAPPATGILHWKNGETLVGDIATASGDSLNWKTPLFEDPLQLEWQVLDRIEWPQQPVATADPFSITLRDGSLIYGNLVSISDDSVGIHSARHGDTLLKRSEVLSARRLQRASLLFSGPRGDLGWESMQNQPDGNPARNPNLHDPVPALGTGPGGALEIRTWNRSAYLDLALPNLIDLEFRVHSSKRPEFMLSIGEGAQQSLRVSTWDNELVLVVGNQFKTIRKIEDDEREVALRVCWDRKAKICSVFNSDGELIAAWDVPSLPTLATSGIIVQNKGLDLSLDFLRVRAWDGKPPAKIDPKQARVELADGRCISGEILAGPPGLIKFQAPGQNAPADLSLKDVDAVVFSTDPPQTASPETTFLYADGTVLFGRITSIADRRAEIATSFTSKPLVSQMDLLRELLIKAPVPRGAAAPPSLDGQDKIVIQDTTLHGKLGTVGDGQPRWIPVGGLKASLPSRTLTSVITRTLPADVASPPDPALFYLSSGDVLPGSLGSIDRTGAEFESSLMDARKLPAGELDAIQFGASARFNVRGFGNPGWHIVKGDEGSVRRTDDVLEMDPGTAIAYPSILQCNEITFKYSTSGFSATRLRLFCAGTDGTHSMNLLIGRTGNQFISGLEGVEGQFENQSQVAVKPGEAVLVRLMIEENQVELYVNDTLSQQFPIEPAKCAGFGMIIEPASIWGNAPFHLSLSDFSATSLPGNTWLPEVNNDIKTQVLTVPRFQKHDPPQHLLLAANGDVLRGEIEAATSSTFEFRCGLDTLNVPRDRVKAVIWLKQPGKNPAADIPAEHPPPNPLDYRLQMRVRFQQIDLNSIIGFLRSQDGNLKFKMPEVNDQRRIQVFLSPETIGQALEKICSLFDLHYQVDTDGTIVLEAATQVMPGLVGKSYWLKPGAIAETASAQEVLAAKGITFPDGSSAQWQPKACVLSMVNTPQNQDKLAALLDSDFGGSPGSPTHWLLLTGGGRLCLALDKFDQDFFIGHNPIYGSCKVPLSQIYVIRTSAPEPSPTMRSLADWHLVNAPEPVLPEAGNENSPLLGKAAATFKLPLLEGGDFDLDAAKGQVVVLDFWASWCGPCVKSLPGLIDALSSFPADRVKLIGVNQGESPAQVKHFLETRGFKLTVAMDADQSVGQKYGVDAIPHTVIVGPDGKVAWVQTGYSPDGDTDASDAVKRLLAPPTPGQSSNP
jgi:peroxiredoxin